MPLLTSQSIKIRIKRIIPPLLLSLLLAGCGLPDIRLKRAVAKEEVVGLWVLSPESLKMVKNDRLDPYKYDGVREHRIEIRADGTCRFASLMQMPTEYFEGKGRWEIAKTSDDSRSSQLILYIEKNGTYSFSLDFKEEKGRLILWEFFGDPDSWEFLEYTKAPNQNVRPN